MPMGCAVIENVFTIAPGAFLDYLPEYLIPQRDAELRQRTQIRVAPTGGFFSFETLAPGRTGMGDVLAYRALGLSLDLWMGETYVCRERYTLRPGDSWARTFATPYYGSVLLVHPQISGFAAEASRQIVCGTGLLVGFSEPYPGLVVGKVIASSSVGLREAMHRVRMRAYARIGLNPPPLRRISF
jgi:urease accessory protein